MRFNFHERKTMTKLNIFVFTFKNFISELKEIFNRISFLEKSLNYISHKVSIERSDPDGNGIYRCITYRRPDNTLLKVSLLEHDRELEVNGGIYNKRIISFYDTYGLKITEIVNYQLKYDLDGLVISETIIS